MKSLLFLLLVTCACADALALSYTSVVSTASVLVAPPAGASTTNTWAPSTYYTNGQAVRVSGRTLYCVVAGTSSDSPTEFPRFTDESGNILESDGGSIIWQLSPRIRHGISFYNGSTNTAYLSVGAPAALLAGLPVLTTGLIILTGPDAPGGAVYAISGAGEPATLSIMDW